MSRREWELPYSSRSCKPLRRSSTLAGMGRVGDGISTATSCGECTCINLHTRTLTWCARERPFTLPRKCNAKAHLHTAQNIETKLQQCGAHRRPWIPMGRGEPQP